MQKLVETKAKKRSDEKLNINLPQIKIPIFDGDITKFPTYADMFQELIR